MNIGLPEWIGIAAIVVAIAIAYTAAILFVCTELVKRQLEAQVKATEINSDELANLKYSASSLRKLCSVVETNLSIVTSLVESLEPLQSMFPKILVEGNHLRLRLRRAVQEALLGSYDANRRFSALQDLASASGNSGSLDKIRLAGELFPQDENFPWAIGYLRDRLDALGEYRM